MAISYVGAGTYTGSAGAMSVPMPAGIAQNDILVLIVGNANQSFATPSGWTSGAPQGSLGRGVGGASGAIGIQCFWKRAGASEGNVAVADSGDKNCAIVFAFRGGLATGTPIVEPAVASNASTSVDFGAISAMNANSALLFIAYSGNSTISMTGMSSALGFTLALADSFQTVGTSGFRARAGYQIPSGVTSKTSPSANVTNASSINTVGYVIEILASLDAPVVGTLKSLTGSVAVSNKVSLTLAGTKAFYTAAIAVANKESLAVAGTLPQLTAAAAVSNKESMALVGTLGFYTAAAAVDLASSNSLDVSGTLGKLTGAAVVGIDVPVAVSGVLPKLTSSVVMDLHQGVFVAGTLAPLTGDIQAVVTLPSGALAIDGSLPFYSGDASLAMAQSLALAGTLPKLSASVNSSTLFALSVDGILPLRTGHIIAASLERPITFDGTLPAYTGAGSADSGVSLLCYDVGDDRRELVLSRLAVVLGALGVAFGRNDPVISESALPKITMLDADEDANRDVFDRGRPADGPNRIGVTPQVYITLAADTPELAGGAMSEWEETITSAVLNDATLRSLCVDGRMEFNGIESAVASGRTLLGQMSLDFTFWYRLDTEEPCAPPTVDVTGLEGREAIIEALGQIIEQTEGVASWARNDLEAPDDAVLYPRVILLDGSERTDPSGFSRRRPSNAPMKVFMEPELYILAAGDDVTVAGPELNRIRLMLLRGILNEPVLASLVMDGDIRYEGCQTAMAAGRGMTGEMGMVISLVRVMRP